MSQIIRHPSELQWIEGDLPDVHTVPYDCRIMAWFVHNISQQHFEQWRNSNYSVLDPATWNGKLSRIEMVLPWQNELNPLRWCDSSCHPIGFQEKVTHWAWINRGSPKDEQKWQESGF